MVYFIQIWRVLDGEDFDIELKLRVSVIEQALYREFMSSSDVPAA